MKLRGKTLDLTSMGIIKKQKNKRKVKAIKPKLKIDINVSTPKRVKKSLAELDYEGYDTKNVPKRGKSPKANLKNDSALKKTTKEANSVKKSKRI